MESDKIKTTELATQLFEYKRKGEILEEKMVAKDIEVKNYMALLMKSRTENTKLVRKRQKKIVTNSLILVMVLI